MLQHDDLHSELLVHWLSECSEKQLRFITFGLLSAILRGKETLIRSPENADCLSTLTNGLLFTALVKKNCNDQIELDAWLGKAIDMETLQEAMQLFHLDPNDIK